ncbi:MFS transporter [Actinomadura craniellae]|uniref:MFS transporter n=2 Tax=Actinomadura craniellae TaxID=2231787 RepID=A0A365GZS4_9ACTN|nr:MFS transporter [Actinomadura craniellae]
MSNLDVFIVNVALPEIGRYFPDASLASLSWVLNAYAVVFAALLVPAGNFADRVGARGVYLSGIVVFTAASAACALAPDVWSLVAARVVQAFGAALLLPSSLGLLLAASPPERRMSMVRAWTAISGLAVALGPVFGGLLTGIDWHWAFLVNVPIGIAALVVGWRVLPRVPARDLPRPDLFGAAMLTVAIAALALGLVRSEDWGWLSAGTLGSLAVALVLLAGFVLRSARHEAPVLPLSMLRLPAFAPATLANILFSVAFAGMLLSVALWCQQVWDWSPLQTGLAIAPGPLMVPALAMTSGSYIRRWGAGPIAFVGSLTFAAGIAWWYALMEPGGGYVTGMLPGMLLTGVGVGLTLPTLIGAAVSAVPPQSFSTGSGVVTMARQIGMVLGVALLVVAMGGSDELASAFDAGWLATLAAAVAAAALCVFVGRAGRAPQPERSDQ